MISVEQAELHFLNEDYARAHDIFAALPAEDTSRQVEYMTAVSLEFSGRLEEAHTAYTPLAQQTDDLGVARAARLGQIRTWTKSGQYRSAKNAALELLLAAGDHELLVASAFHLLSHAAILHAYARVEDLLTDGIQVLAITPRPDTLRDLPVVLASNGPIESTSTSNDPMPSPSFDLLDRLGNKPHEIHVRCRVADISAGALLEQLARVTRLKIVVAQDARTMLDQIRLKVDTRDIDVATFLDAVVEPRRMTWQPQGDEIRIRFDRDVPRNEKLAAIRTQAERISLTSITVHPDHRLYEQTFVGLGNVAYWTKRYQEAAAYYTELTLRGASPSASKASWFNLAKVYWQLNRREECREALINTVDQAAGKKIESVAYYLLGLLDLEDFRPPEATRHFGRALSLSKDDRLRTRAALDMAAAQLIADNPKAANAVLTEYRGLIRVEPVRPPAVFLNAYARFQAAANSQQRIDEGQDLVASIAHVQPRDFDRSIGIFLLGSALQELGYDDQAEQVYAAVIPAPDHELRSRIIFRMAETTANNGRYRKSHEYLRKLVEGTNAIWQRRALLKIARNDFEQGRYDECLQAALELLPVCETQAEKMAVLEVTGRAFEKKNNHYQAALCFAGMMPSEGMKEEREEDEIDLSGEQQDPNLDATLDATNRPHLSRPL